MLGALFVTTALLTPQAASADPAGAPPAPTLLLVLDLVAEGVNDEDTRLVSDALRQAAARQAGFVVDGPDTLTDDQRAIAATCKSARCLATIGDHTPARFILYGTLTRRPGPDTATLGPLSVEIKMYDVERARPLSRWNAEAPVAPVLAAVVPRAFPGILPSVVPAEPAAPIEQKAPKKPTIFDSPIFGVGVAIFGTGAIFAVAGAAFALDAELKLGRPEIHRDLKKDALRYGPYGLYVAAGGAAVAAVGAGVIATSFLVPLE